MILLNIRIIKGKVYDVLSAQMPTRPHRPKLHLQYIYIYIHPKMFEHCNFQPKRIRDNRKFEYNVTYIYI